MQTPDAQPRVEPLRTGGPNKPYTVLGQQYSPHSSDVPLRERGLASWYGRKFHGKPTANGEVYDMYAMTAAHRTMPLPSYARVVNPANGRAVVVRVNDRGPFHPDRVIDLSYTAALKLGLLGGVAPVEVERITHEAIRSGSWRWPEGGAVALPTPALPAVRPEPGAQAGTQTGAQTGAPTGSLTGGPTSATTASAAVLPAPAPAPAAATAPAPGLSTAAGDDPARPVAAGAAGFWLQFGAFRERAGADSLRQRLAQEAAELAERLAVFTERNLHRVQAGPYASRAEALQHAERLAQRLGAPAVLVERR